MRIGSTIIFHLSKLWTAEFFILCDVIFLVRLQEKFDIDHSWQWKGEYWFNSLHVHRSQLMTSSYQWRSTTPPHPPLPRPPTHPPPPRREPTGPSRSWLRRFRPWWEWPRPAAACWPQPCGPPYSSLTRASSSACHPGTTTWASNPAPAGRRWVVTWPFNALSRFWWLSLFDTGNVNLTSLSLVGVRHHCVTIVFWPCFLVCRQAAC